MPHNYRTVLAQLLGLDNLNIHVIEEHTFDQYHLNSIACAVSLRPPSRITLSHVIFAQSWSQTPRNMRLLWYCFGYYRRFRPLLMECLKTLGYDVSREPEQIRFSGHSSTYRIPSSPDHIFFKTCPVRSNEMFNTQVMSHSFPTNVVCLIGLVPELNDVLILDAMRHWADFQQRFSASVVQLKARSFAVYDKAWMNKGVEELRNYCRDHKLISQQQLALMEKCNGTIEETFMLWKSSGIPETIVHGDLSEDNLAHPGGFGTPLVIFDLRTVFIGYRFFALRDAAGRMMPMRESTYLRSWKQYADPETINALAELTRPMDYLVTAIMRTRDKALWSEFIACEIRSNLRSFVEQTKNLPVCALPS